MWSGAVSVFREKVWAKGATFDAGASISRRGVTIRAEVMAMAAADDDLTMEQIQGRLNQREVPWLATPSDGLAVMFTPKSGTGVSVFWDRGHPPTPSFDEIVNTRGVD